MSRYHLRRETLIDSLLYTEANASCVNARISNIMSSGSNSEMHLMYERGELMKMEVSVARMPSSW